MLVLMCIITARSSGLMVVVKLREFGYIIVEYWYRA